MADSLRRATHANDTTRHKDQLCSIVQKIKRHHINGTVAAFSAHPIYFMIGRLAVASLTKRNEHTLYRRFRFYFFPFRTIFFFVRLFRTRNAFKCIHMGISKRSIGRECEKEFIGRRFSQHEHTQHII